MKLGPSNKFWCLAALAGVIGGTTSHGAPSVRTRDSYQSIVERNPFGLKPPPPPPDPSLSAPPIPPPVKTDISLTGITTIGYPKVPKRAYFQTKEANKKDPNFYALSEGQSKDNIEVLHIDEKRPATVKIRMGGTEQTLTFESNGIKPPASAPMPGAPGAPGLPPNGLPGGAPGAPPPGFPQPAGQHPQPFNQPGNNQQSGQPNQEPRTIPARPLRAGLENSSLNAGAQTIPGATQDQNQQQDQDPAVQILNMKAQEQYNKRRNIPFPPSPPLQ